MKCYMGHFGKFNFIKSKISNVVDETPSQERIIMEQQPQNKVTLPYGRARITPEMQKQIDAKKEFLKQIQLSKSERANYWNPVNSPNLVSNLLPQSSSQRTAVLDTAPAKIIQEPSVVNIESKMVEQPKKSNAGIIAGVAALGVAAYFYTKE